jgi:hypothetical protein
VIAELSEQVLTTPLISLIGPPGIGKTTQQRRL